MKALIIGSTTIDVLNDTVRVGGTTYYGGLTLSRYLGDETHVLTTIDDNVSSYFHQTFSDLGISFHAVKCGKVPHFVIKNGKAVNVFVSECRIPAEVAGELISIIKPDIIFLAPVYREVDVREYINLLKSLSGFTMLKVLDIQGLVRVSTSKGIECFWCDDLLDLMSLVNFTHGNLKEFCFSSNANQIIKTLMKSEKLRGTAVAVTTDSSDVYLLYNSRCFKTTPLRVTSIDEVGAGDVFTASVAHYMAERKDLFHAVRAGVVAASLKVWRASDVWFTEEDLKYYLPQVVFEECV
ncbi:MAG: PfkB family carbohydrate kinase [Desulfurococcaceae archaeon TW002]